MTHDAGRYHRLMAALFGFVALHMVALVAIALLLAPGLDAGSGAMGRAAYIAAHPVHWRIGWLPWQLCALGDLCVSAALVAWTRARGDRHAAAWAWAALAATLVAVVPDQWGEAIAVTELVDLARGARLSGGAALAFAERERWFFLMTATCGNSGYVLMTLCWTVAIVRSAPSDAPTRGFAVLTAVTLALFSAGSLVMLRATRTPGLDGMQLSEPIHGLGFPLLDLWGVWAAIVIGRSHHARHARVDEARYRLVWPTKGALGALAARLANAPGLRDLLRPLPWIDLGSDIRNVVYLNWLVPTERMAAWLPPPLKIHALGDRAALSILTYTHGGFGPVILGPLRRLLPSPRQSNWRLYIEPPEARPEPGRDAIYFVVTVLSSGPHAVASRLMADGLPAQVPECFEHHKSGPVVTTRIAPGQGSAPDLQAVVREGGEPTLPPQWLEHFDDWSDALAYLVPQNRAVSVLPARGAVIESRISIPIALEAVIPARLETFESRFLGDIVEGCEPLAFVVPEVEFRALGERVASSS